MVDEEVIPYMIIFSGDVSCKDGLMALILKVDEFDDSREQVN